uniref:CLE-2 n=1 Tax=Rotylenchulus reniformis TaxID=239373 RepID=A0A0K0QV96_ROTRE|nr:CLE-2 [Rotylenchulus reniformis]
MNFIFALSIVLLIIGPVVNGTPTKDSTKKAVDDAKKGSDQKKSADEGSLGGIGKVARVLTTAALLLTPAASGAMAAKPEFQPVGNRKLLAENAIQQQQLNSTELFKSMGFPLPPTPYNESKRESPGGPDPKHH